MPRVFRASLLARSARRAPPRAPRAPRRGLAVGLPDAIRQKTQVTAHSSPRSTRERVDYPPIRGTSESHVFLAPFNPDAPTLARYDAAVADWNDKNARRPGATTVMRPVFLCLDFRAAGPQFVCQSARHVKAETTEFVIDEVHADADHFEAHGFEVLRRKVECYGWSDGVPQTDEDALAWPDKYFEFHLRINRREDAPDARVTTAEVAQLRALSESYTERFGVPVPLSFNAYKEGRQRFLNLRVGHCGLATALASVEHIKRDLSADPALKYLEVGKSHIEYVWWDDNRNMDRGWIDFTADEQESILGLAA